MKINHTTTSIRTFIDCPPRLPGTPEYVVLPSGGIKRIYVDRDVAADGGPAWVIEELTGLCRRHRARDLAVAGFVVSGQQPGAAPALWLETEAEVRFVP